MNMAVPSGASRTADLVHVNTTVAKHIKAQRKRTGLHYGFIMTHLSSRITSFCYTSDRAIRTSGSAGMRFSPTGKTRDSRPQLERPS